MSLVENWKSAPKWLSVQAFALAGAIQVTWVSLPPDLQARVPDDWVSYATVAITVLGIIGRLWDQSK